MQSDFQNYIGSSPQDTWIKIIDRTYQQRLGGYIPPDMFPWDVARKEIHLAPPFCVRVIAEELKTANLPQFIYEAESIEYLDMPLRFAGVLTNSSIPETVKTLGLYGEGSFTFATNLVLPNVERIFVAPGILYFTHKNLPNLKHMEINLDRKKAMLEQVQLFESLIALGVQPCPSDIFVALSRTQLKYLRLNNSKLVDLMGIDSLPHLTDLWLHKFTQLRTLESLNGLPRLEDLTLSYCNKIADVNVLFNLPNLRRLFAWRCRSQTLHQFEPMLISKIADVSIS